MNELLFIDTSKLIEWGGLAIIIFLVFAETGLLIGLLLPAGETLIFTSGVLASTQTIHIHIAPLLSILILAGLAGDITGYYIGKKLGKKLYENNSKWYIKKKYVMVAERIVLGNKHTSIIFGKFLPVVRPFVPAISGVTGMRTSVFLALTIISCLVFMSTFALGGYFLGIKFPAIKDYIGWILPISIVIACTAIYFQVRKLKAEKD